MDKDQQKYGKKEEIKLDRLSSSEWKSKGRFAVGRAGKDSKRGQREKGEDGKRREAKYLLPCLSESKRCQKVESGGRRKNRERERGTAVEETRASYCDSSAGKQDNEMERK